MNPLASRSIFFIVTGANFTKAREVLQRTDPAKARKGTMQSRPRNYIASKASMDDMMEPLWHHIDLIKFDRLHCIIMGLSKPFFCKSFHVFSSLIIDRGVIGANASLKEKRKKDRLQIKSCRTCAKIDSKSANVSNSPTQTKKTPQTQLEVTPYLAYTSTKKPFLRHCPPTPS